MGAESVFKRAAGLGGAGAGAGAAGAVGLAQGKSLVNPAGYGNSQNSIATQLRADRESEWRSRAPMDSTQHRLGTMPATDGSQVVVRMSDLKNGVSMSKDGGVILTVSDIRGQKQVVVDHGTYDRMSQAFEVSKRSWGGNYSRWRDEGEGSGFVAGYDGIGQKAARRTEF